MRRLHVHRRVPHESAPERHDLPTPPCTDEGFYGLRFKVSPEGAVLHTCKENPLVWYDESGDVAYDNAGDALLHLGYGGQALTTTRVVDLATMTSVDVIGLPYAPIITIRALPPDRFRVVVDVNNAQELWEIDPTGTATLAGTYPATPAGYSPVSDGARLDPAGALFQMAHQNGVFNDVIFRREPGGAAEIIYDETTDPQVKLHISSLLTEP